MGVGKDEGSDRGDVNDGDDTSVTVRAALEEEKKNKIIKPARNARGPEGPARWER